jgi:YHS domain-containing protein
LSGVRPETVIDRVCGMQVRVQRPEVAGLTIESGSRTFAFCGAGCLRAFREGPESYAASAVLAGPATDTAAGSTALPVIDEGMRRWYESCDVLSFVRFRANAHTRIT